MINFKFPSTVIRNSYREVFDDSLDDKQKRLSARNVVDTIINGVFFEKKDVIDLYNGINTNIIEKQIRRKGKSPYRPYGDSFGERLSFLCEHRLIEEHLKSEYLFVYADAGLHSKAHDRFKKGEEKLQHVIKIYLNEILESFLDKFEESKDFLIPMKVIKQEDIDFHNRITNRIETFWNLKKDKPWYIKYRTIFSYIAILVFLRPMAIISIIILSIGIYMTQKFVFNSKVKRQRHAFHFIICIFLMVNITNAVRKVQTSEDITKSIFDPIPIKELNTSFGIARSNDSLYSKRIDLSYLKKEESELIVIEQYYKNIGEHIIMAPYASLDIVRNKNELLLEGKLFSKYHPDKVSLIDSVFIIIKKPYHIEFIDGIIKSPFDPYCKGYGYIKTLTEMYFQKPKSYQQVKGSMLSIELDTVGRGNCSSGSVKAIFKITKY
jgi:hypothetical protein